MTRNLKTLPFNRSIFAEMRILVSMILFMAILGCGTTTTRVATEQLLMSDAVDQAISKIDFESLHGRKVFLDTLYLHSVKGVGFVNSEYIISSLRQQLTAAQCMIQDTREEADVIVEPRVGALGTDGHEVVYGIPQSGSLSSAAAVLSGAPVPAIPEISFGKSNAQFGIAKVIVFAYDRESRKPIWQSGIAKAESTSRNTWYLGAGPFQKGSIYEGMRFAGQKLPPAPHLEDLASERWFQDGSYRLDEPVAVESASIVPGGVGYGESYSFESEELLKQGIPAAMNPDDVATTSDEVTAQSGVTEASHEEAVENR